MATIDMEFRQVVDAFKTQLTSEELPYFQFNGVGDVLQTLESIQQKHAAQKRLTFMKRVDPFVKTIMAFGKIVEVFLNVSEILAFVWVRFMDLLGVHLDHAFSMY
jgi:hypothetical protein